HKPIEFATVNMVWLNTSNIPTPRPSKQLDWKRFGPFRIVKRIALHAYKLDLPPTMRHIHDTFHISLLDPVKLTPLVPDPHGLPPAPPTLYVKDNHEYFEIEDILDSKREGRRLYYLIKWKGYPDSENSWEPLSGIPARGLVKEFHRRNPANQENPVVFTSLDYWLDAMFSCCLDFTFTLFYFGFTIGFYALDYVCL